MIKAVVFDLWYTLVERDFHLEKTLREHLNLPSPKGKCTKKFESSVQLKKWKTYDGMARNFLREFDVPVNDKNVKFVVRTFKQGIKVTRFIPRMKNLVIQLNENYKTGLISNTTIFESKIICCKLFVDHLFNVEVYSWQTGSLKPSRKNFNLVCKRLKLRPAECVFVDDNLKNVKAARKYGFKAVHFKGVRMLRVELKKLGVNI